MRQPDTHPQTRQVTLPSGRTSEIVYLDEAPQPEAAPETEPEPVEQLQK